MNKFFKNLLSPIKKNKKMCLFIFSFFIGFIILRFLGTIQEGAEGKSQISCRGYNTKETCEEHTKACRWHNKFNRCEWKKIPESRRWKLQRLSWHHRMLRQLKKILKIQTENEKKNQTEHDKIQVEHEKIQKGQQYYYQKLLQQQQHVSTPPKRQQQSTNNNSSSTSNGKNNETVDINIFVDDAQGISTNANTKKTGYLNGNSIVRQNNNAIAT